MIPFAGVVIGIAEELKPFHGEGLVFFTTFKLVYVVEQLEEISILTHLGGSFHDVFPVR